MSNIYTFPPRKIIDTRERLRHLGELLQKCYDLGLEPDPELEQWIAEAELAIKQKIIIKA